MNLNIFAFSMLLSLFLGSLVFAYETTKCGKAYRVGDAPRQIDYLHGNRGSIVQLSYSNLDAPSIEVGGYGYFCMDLEITAIGHDGRRMSAFVLGWKHNKDTD